MSHLPGILLIDDDADDRRLVALVLAGAFGDVDVVEVADAVALVRAMNEGRFGIVLTEHELTWIRAGDVLRLMRDLRPDCPVVVVTGGPIEKVSAELLPLAPDGLVPKSSAGLADLPQTLRAALFHVRRRQAATAPDAGYRRLLDALPVGVFVASRDGTLLDANPALASILGHARAEDCIQRSLDDLFATRGDAEAWRAGLTAATGVTTVEVPLRRADGSTVRAQLSAWLGGGGPAGQIQGLVEDRSTAHAAQQALAKRNEELARSSAELEEMAYVVSHDLRQPLTQVVRYLDLLAKEAASKLGADGRGFLEHARRGAGRLEEMVDAVLRCARIESRGEAFTAVDLQALLARVIEQLAAEREAAGAQVTSAPLPTLPADVTQMELLFQNLLSNAFKFRDEATPRVHLEAEDAGEHWHLRFRDNGIGIDPKDAQRVFVMFQRLHTEAEYPGTGIGLAVCRRIVSRHGGRIWVESQPGKGATFHVTLAKRPPAGASAQREE